MGFDKSRFVGQVISQFVCFVCNNVLREPVETVACQHVYCKECITSCLKREKICPQDKLPLTESGLRPVSELVVTILGELIINCDYASAGCRDSVKLATLAAHCEGCGFSPFAVEKCEKGCGAAFRRKDLKSHSCFSFLLNKNKEMEEMMKKYEVLIKKMVDEKDAKDTVINRLKKEMSLMEQKLRAKGSDSGTELESGSLEMQPNDAVAIGKQSQGSVASSNSFMNLMVITSWAKNEQVQIQVQKESGAKTVSPENEGQRDESGKNGALGRILAPKEGFVVKDDDLSNDVIYSVDSNSESDVEKSRGYCSGERRSGSSLSPVNVPFTSRERKTFNSTIACKGCQKFFPCHYNGKNAVPSPNYYTHCILNCDKYKELGMIKECGNCRRLFVNREALNCHLNRKGKNRGDIGSKAKPQWMSTPMFKRLKCHSSFNGTLPCKGCGERFDCFISRKMRRYPCLEYYVHCVEKCEKYKNLGLAKRCNDCSCVFIDNLSCSRHKCYKQI